MPGALPPDGEAAHPPCMTPSSAARRRRSSLIGRISAAACISVAAAIAGALLLQHWLLDPRLAGAIPAPLPPPSPFSAAPRPLVSAAAMFRALAGTVTSYRDGDFAFSLAWGRNDELGDLVTAHNALGDTLRSQREALVHRELLLDT